MFRCSACGQYHACPNQGTAGVPARLPYDPLLPAGAAVAFVPPLYIDFVPAIGCAAVAATPLFVQFNGGW